MKARDEASPRCASRRPLCAVTSPACRSSIGSATSAARAPLATKVAAWPRRLAQHSDACDQSHIRKLKHLPEKRSATISGLAVGPRLDYAGKASSAKLTRVKVCRATANVSEFRIEAVIRPQPDSRERRFEVDQVDVHRGAGRLAGLGDRAGARVGPADRAAAG